MPSDTTIHTCKRFLAGIRRRLLLTASVEALALGTAVWMTAFSAETALHSRLLLSSGARSILRLLLPLASVSCSAGWFFARVRGKLGFAYLASLAEESFPGFNGRLAATADFLAAPGPDPVASLLAGETAEVIARSRPAVPVPPSRALVKAVAFAGLTSPLLLLSGGLRRMGGAITDCLFPQEQVSVERAFRPGPLRPEGPLLPSGRKVSFSLRYEGITPMEAIIEVETGGNRRTIPLDKENPGILAASAVFGPGEASLTPLFRLRTLGGSRLLRGRPRRYRFVPPVEMLSSEIVVRSETLGEWKAGGLDALLPPTGECSVHITASSQLASVRIENSRVPVDISGPSAVIRLGPPRETALTFTLVPQTGFPSRPYTLRLAVGKDAPPRLTAFIRDGVLNAFCTDDWGLSRLLVSVEGPKGVEKKIPIPLGGRNASRLLNLSEAVPGPPGRYLVSVKVFDSARPTPNFSTAPLLQYDRKDPLLDDPLLSSPPKRLQRFLARKPPPQTPPPSPPTDTSSSPRNPSRRPESLGPPPPSRQDRAPARKNQPSRPTSPSGPRYSSMPPSGHPPSEDKASSTSPPSSSPGPPSSAGGAGSEHPPGSPPSDRPRSLPEGGVAGAGRNGGPSSRTGRSSPAGGNGPSGETASQGPGPSMPTDGGMPSGDETAPTPVFEETVDRKQVEALDISEAEIRNLQVRHPFPGRNSSPGTETERKPGRVDLRAGTETSEHFDISILPARFRALLRYLSSQASPRHTAGHR